MPPIMCRHARWQALMDDKRKDHIYARAYESASSGCHVDPRTIISALKDVDRVSQHADLDIIPRDAGVQHSGREQFRQ